MKIRIIAAIVVIAAIAAAAFLYLRNDEEISSELTLHGNVDIRAAVIIAVMMFLGSWLGSYVSNRTSGPILRLLFAVFVCGLGVYLLIGALRRLGWI